MLASIPANTLNQNQTDSRILNRFSLTESRSRLNLPDGPHGFWPHVPGIGMATMPASERKRLAGRATGNKRDPTLKGGEIDIANVTLMWLRPLGDGIHSIIAILTKRVAAPAVPRECPDRC